MDKKYIILVLAILTICSCNKQANDLTSQELSGNVKSVRTTGYKATIKFGEICAGEILRDNFINNLIEFNKDGHITTKSNFDEEGNLSKKSISSFNNDGNVTNINIYDKNGEEIGKTVYKYNENQKITQIVDYNKSGEIEFTAINEWDGDICTKNQYISNLSEGQYNINEYNGNTIVKSIIYDKNNNPTGEYTYFENGKIAKIVTKEYTITITYNNQGLCSSIENGQLYTTDMYEWIKGYSFVYEYEYDAKGNWIKKVEFDKNSHKAERVFVREIDYY